MTGSDQLKRTIEACRRAGLPVIGESDCTCDLHGRLVVLARESGLQVVWPYDLRCPIHGARERKGTAAPVHSRPRRSRSQTAREPWARRKADVG